ncbi:hypothetical protein H4S02_000383, partial [Coemansia sp. RSA 2611]
MFVIPCDSAPAGSVISFEHTPDEIRQAVKLKLDAERALLDAVAAEPTPTFAKVVARINHMDDEHESEYLTSYLLAELSPDASIRSAAAQATKLVE